MLTFAPFFRREGIGLESLAEVAITTSPIGDSGQGRSSNMMEKLTLAYETMKQGKIEELTEVVAQLKALPRTAEGSWDLNSAGDVYEAARVAYPVYCAYETVCNKKEGYPDLIAQIRAWKKQTSPEVGEKKYAAFLDMLLQTLVVMSPEIYEYYREILDIFRESVKAAIVGFYEDGAFSKEGKTDAMIKNTIRKACEEELLLAEKYEAYIE